MKKIVTGNLPESNVFAVNLSSLSKSAFTLAEVLVTLGIIGVVSAMTVPSLMQNYQRQSYVTQLHKVYNLFGQAVNLYLNEKNALNVTEAGLTAQNERKNFMTKNFKIINDCGSDVTKCFANDYKSLNGTAVANPINAKNLNCYVIASGSSVCIGENKFPPADGSPAGADDLTYGASVASIFVDINGKAGPNIIGRDLFGMAIENEGVINSLQAPGSGGASGRQKTICKAGVVGACMEYLLHNNNWTMDY